jgi:4-hydroxybenzoate polyprenyltransferase
MGLCRGLNLLLGMSIMPVAMGFYWGLAFVPIIYIAAITMVSRGEVHGSNKSALYGAAGLYIVVLLALLGISLLNNTLLKSLPFAFLFCLMIFPALQRAILKPEGPRIGKAVKAGVIGLILMNATWAAAFDNLLFALIISLLLPVSILLARLFAVT